ncbi:hypothetical protein J6590_100727 [Homalodisca vitripennis]|nr:hypothetical protein J6590_100727 [Homalodisca vitripennis]
MAQTMQQTARAGNNLPITVDLFHDGVRSLKWKVKGACLCSSITQAEQPPTHPTLVLDYTSTLCLQYVLW